jgi:transcriptional regulator
MYIPPLLKEERIEVLHAAMRQAQLATLVTLGAEGLVASHLPVLVEPAPAPYGTLIGHFSKANPQWRDLAAGVEALAIFTGPHAYITPDWYASKREHGKVVPTWNYVAIHAYGTLRCFDDPARLREDVRRLTRTMEAGRPTPWATEDAPEEFIAGMLKGIVGFELPIARLEGKWKMSQNRPQADRDGVVAGLRRERGPDAEGVAALVAAVRQD